ncbi:MAG TPA: tetratricopeptide repeat protein, partial [Chroococcales cyanobacterium]
MRDHSKDSAKLTPAFIATGSILCLLFCSATAAPESAAANPNKDAAGVTLKAMSPKLDDSPTKPKPAPALKPTEMSETAMMAKGLKLSSDKRWDEAADVFKEVVAKNPRNVNAYYNLGSIAENRGDFDQALNFYKSAQGLSPNDSEIGEAVLAMKKKTGAAAGGGSLASNSAANQAGYPGSSNQPWQKK